MHICNIVTLQCCKIVCIFFASARGFSEILCIFAAEMYEAWHEKIKDIGGE